MADRIYNVLFLCTGNSARSIIAEAILNREGRGRFRAYSAGSHPRGEVNPYALAVLGYAGFELRGLRSKSWDEFGKRGAPVMDFIITLCDEAAGEACPVWPGHPMTAHWGIPDPAKATGSEHATERAFADALRMLQNRIGAMLSLPIATLDSSSLQVRLTNIGAMARHDRKSSAAA
jgi:arsenate reductase